MDLSAVTLMDSFFILICAIQSLKAVSRGVRASKPRGAPDQYPCGVVNFPSVSPPVRNGYLTLQKVGEGRVVRERWALPSQSWLQEKCGL